MLGPLGLFYTLVFSPSFHLSLLSFIFFLSFFEIPRSEKTCDFDLWCFLTLFKVCPDSSDVILACYREKEGKKEGEKHKKWGEINHSCLERRLLTWVLFSAFFWFFLYLCIFFTGIGMKLYLKNR